MDDVWPTDSGIKDTEFWPFSRVALTTWARLGVPSGGAAAGWLRGENALRPQSTKVIGLVATALATSAVVSPARGGVVEFTDKDAWIAAVGRFTTVDFVGFPPGTFITDQYAGLGIHFTDGNDSIPPFDPITFPNNGWGLDGNGDINVSFDSDQAWLAVEFPGFLRFQLFSEGQLIYDSGLFGQVGFGNAREHLVEPSGPRRMAA